MGKHLNSDKSKAKVAGLKSTVVISDNLVMTSFGKGNSAIVEKKIVDSNITSINSNLHVAFKNGNDKKAFSINHGDAETNNPLYSASTTGSDLIGAKSLLEERFFGETYPNDNLHIQVIYNILDIEKILSSHVNSIIYTINNLNPRFNPNDDIFATLSTRNTFPEFLDPKAHGKNDTATAAIDKTRERFETFIKNTRLNYFPNAFFDSDLKTLKRKEEIYYILALLGDLRHYTMHDDASSAKKNKKKAKKENWPYSWDNIAENNDRKKKIAEHLDKIYKHMIKSIDDDFIKNNAKSNFKILFDNFGAEKDENKQKDLVVDFYNFTIRKVYKDLGFSIKKLREQMLKAETSVDYSDKKYNGIRSKLYRFIDYALYRYYSVHSDKQEKIVSALRNTSNDKMKETIYRNEAIDAWKEIKSTVSKIEKQLEKEIANSQITVNTKLYEAALAPYKISSVMPHRFTEIVALMTLFLNGKEINDLITTLINKFDNIESLRTLMADPTVKLDCKFIDEFVIFNDSREIVNELKLLKDASKMSKPGPNAKHAMYMDAATLLGTTATKEELDAMLHLSEDTKVKGKNDFRNFIVNNVIESSRFQYIIRYMPAEEARAIAKNKELIRFVINDIPKEQIDRYYFACNNAKNNDLDEERSFLVDELSKISLNTFERVNNKANVTADSIEALEKQRLCTLISLYLTVIYLVVKNLVNINSRYTLAFHCLERDTKLFGLETKKKLADNKWEPTWSALTRKYIADFRAEYPYEEIPAICKQLEAEGKETRRKSLLKKNRQYRLLEIDCNGVSDYLRGDFRNTVDHLNAVRKAGTYAKDCTEITSYFALYHYIVQRTLAAVEEDKIKNGRLSEEKRETRFDDVVLNGTYCKDLLKHICACFGYNYPRFKNLTIEGLFDMNRPGTKEETGKG